VHAPLLDLALVLGRARPTGRDQKRIVCRAVAVGLLYLRVIPDRSDDRRLEVVHHHASGYTTKEGKGVAVAAQPGFDLLVEHELDVLMSTPREDHDKGPGAMQLAGGEVDHAPCIAKVYLRLFAWLAFHAHRGLGLTGIELAHKTVHCLVRASIAALFQATLDGRDLDVLFEQLLDQIAVRRYGRDVLRRRLLGHGPVSQYLKLLQRRQGTFQQSLGLCPVLVAFDRPPIDLHVSFDLAIA
jgi:hypothetical protein